MPGDGTRANVNEPSWLAAAGVATGAAEAAVRLSDAARVPAIAAAPRPAVVRVSASAELLDAGHDWSPLS